MSDILVANATHGRALYFTGTNARGERMGFVTFPDAHGGYLGSDIDVDEIIAASAPGVWQPTAAGAELFPRWRVAPT